METQEAVVSFGFLFMTAVLATVSPPLQTRGHCLTWDWALDTLRVKTLLSADDRSPHD